MKKVVVTGANGFVGSAVCRALAARGVQILAIVKDEKEDVSSILSLKGIQIFLCDMGCYDRLAQIIPDRDIDAFYHFAWIGVAGPLRGNDEAQMRNIRAVCDLLRACKAMHCGRFVFASSIMTYEVAAQIEAGRKPGIGTLYSSAKLAADYMAAAIAGELGIDYIRAIISNIYGPGERSPRLVNTSLRTWLRGEHCAFSAGEQMYDFIYVEDAAEAFCALGERGKPFTPYYIGSPAPRPLKEFLREMRDAVDPAIPLGLGERPFDGITLTYREFDVQALQRDTGFTPRVPFSEGIRRTLTWIRKEEM